MRDLRRGARALGDADGLDPRSIALGPWGWISRGPLACIGDDVREAAELGFALRPPLRPACAARSSDPPTTCRAIGCTRSSPRRVAPDDPLGSSPSLDGSP